jgi:7-carboxy-7-deazaguanine synthase
MIQIVDMFWTVQGEGFNSGERALFVRLPFCNLKCSWCDTEFNKFLTITDEQFETIALSEKGRFAVITGGEPTMSKNFKPVYNLLKKNGFKIAVESNGTFEIPEGDYWLTVSPKREQKDPYYVHGSAFLAASEFKYVVDDDFDFTILDRHTNSSSKLYLSPEFNNFQMNVEKILNYIKENPQWKISLQTHKWMNIK